MLLNELPIARMEKVIIWFFDDSEPVFDGYYEDWHYRDYPIYLVWSCNDCLCISLDNFDANRLEVGVRDNYDNNYPSVCSE